MYRKEIKVLDCTIRDGGLMNKWQFSKEMVKAVYDGCVAAGVDYMEIGYKSSENQFSRNEYGAWKFCDENEIREIVGDNKTNTKISVLADIGRIDYDDIAPKSESVVDMVRVACYDHQIDKAIHLAEHCIDKGYETTINLMAVSTTIEHSLEEVLNDVAKSRVPTFYLVDSFGSMYSEQIQYFMNKYKAALPGKTIGIHAHNNMQLAFANTIESIIQGANMIDCTMMGLGRGAGNCPTELLLSFLKNPKFNLRPIFEVLEKHLVPLQNDIRWGYYLPYMITGMMNEHPKNGLKLVDSEARNEVVKFFDSVMDGKVLE